MPNIQPLVTLLIPMYNEVGYIEKCLDSIFQQTYSNLQVLIFDGNSTDCSADIVAGMIASRPNFALHPNPRRIQSAAWNKGIELASGDIIGIVSAHAELAPDYVNQAVETLQRTGADLVGGPTFSDAKGYIPETIALGLNTPFGVGDARFHYTESEIESDSVFMGVCWRRVYEHIGGFDEEMVRNQDDELSYRLLKSGGRIICNPAIKSRYYNRADLPSLWKQYFQYGLWKVRVLQKHPRQMRWRQLVPVTFIGVLLIALLFSPWLPGGFVLFALILGAYLTANLLASSLTAVQRGWCYLPLLPIVYAMLHFSYGFGFLAGLLRFARCWRNQKGQVPQFTTLHHQAEIQ